MVRVIRRPLAELDIAEDSVTEADLWIDKLDEKLRLWATQPMMGRSREELASGLRSFAFGRYVVFFLPISDGLDVVRVLHASRDINEHFDAT